MRSARRTGPRQPPETTTDNGRRPVATGGCSAEHESALCGSDGAWEIRPLSEGIVAVVTTLPGRAADADEPHPVQHHMLLAHSSDGPRSFARGRARVPLGGCPCYR